LRITGEPALTDRKTAGRMPFATQDKPALPDAELDWGG